MMPMRPSQILALNRDRILADRILAIASARGARNLRVFGSVARPGIAPVTERDRL